MESCKTLGISIDDHFREVTKMIQLDRASEREVQDFMLIREPLVSMGSLQTQLFLIHEMRSLLTAYHQAADN